MVKRRILLLALVSSVVTSCYYDNGATVYPNGNINCDTSGVTYSQGISQLIAQSCATTNCHASGNGIILLTNYEEIKGAVDKGVLAKRAINNKDMPPQAPLSACDIEKLRQWINTGALNN